MTEEDNPQGLRPLVIALATGSGVGQLAVAASSPLITRIYGPVVVGEFAQWFALVSIAVTFVSLRWEYSFPSAAREDRPALLRVSLGTTLILSAGIGVVAWILDIAVGGIAIGWLALAILIQVTFQILFQWSLNVGQVRSAGAAKAAHGVGQAVLQAGFGAIQATPVAMALGYVGSAVAGLGPLRRGWSLRGRTTIGQMRAVIRRYWQVPLWVCVSGVVNSIGVQFPILFLSKVSAGASGQYAMATRVATAPLVLVSVAIAQVFVSQVAAGRRDRLAHSLTTVWRIGLPIFLSLLIPVAGLGPQLALILLGPEWGAVGEILRLLSPALFMIAASTIVSTLPIALGHIRGEALYQSVLLVLRVIALLVALPFGLKAAVAAYALATTVCLLGYVIWCFKLVGANLLTASRPPRMAIALLLFTCAVSFGGFALFRMTPAPPGWSIAIAALAFLPTMLWGLKQRRLVA